MTRGITFETAAPALRASPARMDVALFVGFLQPRDPSAANRPIAVESAADLARHFETGRALEPGGPSVLAASLAAAVQAFLATGGRRCLVVGLGPPPAHLAGRGARLEALLRLLIGPDAPPVPEGLSAEAIEALPLADLPHPRTPRERRHGLGHLFEAEEAVNLLLPDLPDLLAPPPPQPEAGEPPRPRPVERFVACSTPPPPAHPSAIGRHLASPRLDRAGFTLWLRVLGRILARLHDFAPDRMLLASLPEPAPGLAAELARTGLAARLGAIESEHLRLLQLVHPWLRVPESEGLPGALLPPEAVLAGLLAAHALERGCFLSAAGRPLPEGVRLAAAQADPEERVSLFEIGPRGPRLAVDHTAGADPAWRPAAVRRLMALLLREARGIGTAALFEPSGERLWAETRAGLEALLARAFTAGALRGRNAAEAFSVRCDRSTMSQADIDLGRVIAEVGFLPAVPVEEIRIRLPLAGGGV